MIDILNKYNIGKKKLIGIGIFIIIFFVALPLTLIQVQKQQQLRQRASGVDAVHLVLGSPSNAIRKDEEFTIPLSLFDPQGRDISGIDLTLDYNSNILELIAFNRNTFFSEIFNDKSIPGKIHFVGFNPTLDNNSGSIEIGKLTFKAITQGTGTVDLSNIIVTAANDPKPLEVNIENPRLGSYVVVVPSVIPSPIPTSTSFPSPKPTISIPTSIPISTIVQNTPTSVPTPTLAPYLSPTSVVSPTPSCPLHSKGDANCDGKINILDYEAWRTEFVNEVKGIPTNKTSDFDDKDGITVVDFNIWKTSL